MTALSLPGMGELEQPAAAAPTPARRRYEFFVAGEPKPMGSKTAFVVPGTNRAIVTDGKAGKSIKGWKDSVVHAAVAELGDGVRILGAVRVVMTFHLSRPAGHWGKQGLRPSAPVHPAVKPDLDKLCRSTLDALAVVMLADDARVVTLLLAKVYATRETGCLLAVEEL